MNDIASISEGWRPYVLMRCIINANRRKSFARRQGSLFVEPFTIPPLTLNLKG